MDTRANDYKNIIMKNKIFLTDLCKHTIQSKNIIYIYIDKKTNEICLFTTPVSTENSSSRAVYRK